MPGVVKVVEVFEEINERGEGFSLHNDHSVIDVIENAILDKPPGTKFKVDFSCNYINEGASALAEKIISNEIIIVLCNLSDNWIKDGVAHKWASVIKKDSTSLRELNLDNCRITEDGAQAIITALRSQSQPIILTLSGNSCVTKESLAEIDSIYQSKINPLINTANEDTAEYTIPSLTH